MSAVDVANSTVVTVGLLLEVEFYVANTDKGNDKNSEMY